LLVCFVSRHPGGRPKPPPGVTGAKVNFAPRNVDPKFNSEKFVLTLALIPAFSPREKGNPSPLLWKIGH